MHYYQFNIGDYQSHTSHLDPLEDIAYRRMLDWCYLHEIPLPADVKQIAKKIRMREECNCIEDVLQEFFILKDDGYHSKRVDDEVKNYKSLSSKRKKAANKRWASNSKASKPNASALQEDMTSNTKHKPLTINQEPITNNHKPLKKNGAKAPARKFVKPDLQQVTLFFANEGVLQRHHAEQFLNHYNSVGWVVGKNKPMKDWKASVRQWISRMENGV